MNVLQLASAMLALAFAAVMFVASQLFIEYRSTNNAFELSPNLGDGRAGQAAAVVG